MSRPCCCLVVILLLFCRLVLFVALRCVSSAEEVIHVTGYMGSKVKISCPYDKGYESYEKYLCKKDCGSDDDVLIKTSESQKNKYRINDDKTARIVKTTISDLHSTDAGKYWCGVSKNWKDIYTEVNCCNSVTKIESYAGYSVSFSCPYESQYQNNLKYICRGTRPSMCLQQELITSYNKQHGRFRLDDDNMSTKFTTKISSLTQRDSGRYLCGIQRNSDLHLFYAFELKVKGKQKLGQILLHTESELRREVCIFTAFCFSDSALYVPFTVPLVLLLLIGILVVVVYKWKHYKVKGIFYIHTHAESHPLKCACEKSITVFSAVCFQKMKPLWTQMHPRQKV
uniref:Immunoglobulin domain-containing protein n=1 Tax=Haplochromis burtoni TaxID=8153 RepID=A0A3Q3CAY1_HAPBU